MSGIQAQVLILDDDADVAYAAQLLLRRRAGQVRTLSDPKQLAPALDRLFAGDWKQGRIPPLWDGGTGVRIVDELERLLG